MSQFKVEAAQSWAAEFSPTLQVSILRSAKWSGNGWCQCKSNDIDSLYANTRSLGLACNNIDKIYESQKLLDVILWVNFNRILSVNMLYEVIG